MDMAKKMDMSYRKWQKYAEERKLDRLLAQAVVWGYNDQVDFLLADEIGTDEDRWQAARRALALHTEMETQRQGGMSPEELWKSIAYGNTATAGA